jgi:sugar phosphate isomerase/epimerase
MALGPSNLIFSHLALVQIEPPMTFVSPPFAERCAAAAAGGFDAIGLSHSAYRAELDAGRTNEDLRAILDHHGLAFAEIESIRLAGAAQRADFERDIHDILDMADALGAEQFFVVPGAGSPVDELLETFQWLCDRCAEHGMRVGIEFMDLPAVSAIHSVREALAFTERAQRANGGLCVDTYHFVRGPNEWSDLEAVPGEAVMVIQFSDGAVPRKGSDYIDDTLHWRLPPGEGDFDLIHFVRTLDAAGSRAPWSVEVLGDEMRALPPAEAAQRMASGARSVLAAARG